MSEKKYADLKDFLRKHKTIPENTFTHTALGLPPHSYPGSYCIEDEDLPLFYNFYNKWVFEEGKECHLTEKHKDLSPLLIDLDLRHNVSELKRHYDEQFIKIFLNNYILKIKDIIPDISDDKLVAFVLEKDSPNFLNSKGTGPAIGKFKDGIHIVFPFIVVEPKIQYTLRFRMITDPQIVELFNSIKAVNTIDDIFDICVIERNNWQLLGSCKPQNQTYKVTNIYKVNNLKMKRIQNNYSNKDLLKILSIRNIKTEDIIDSSMISNNLEIEYQQIPKIHQFKKKKKVVNRKKKSPIKKNFLDDEEELSFVKSIVKILSDQRAEQYHLWIRLGWCLHNIDHRLLEDWIEHSKRSEKFVEGECENEWYTMDNEGLALGTLFLWAKEDNPVKYKQLTNKNLRKCMLANLSLEPGDVATVVYLLYKNEFVCASSKKNTWFQFRNHRWIELDNAVELKKKLSSEVIHEYDLLDKFLSDQITQLSDDDEKDLKRKKKETIGKLIKKLKQTPFKSQVVVECGELFHDMKFEEKLDKNHSLIGFENGVYDLEELVFRDGLPEDYINYSTRINYYDHDEDDEDIISVNNFLEQVLPKPNVREYVLTLLGSFLSGKNISEKFHIWTGCGGNGKSKLIELFEYCFGDYCCKLPVTLLTQQRARAEGPTPALVRTKGKRFACLQEPDKNEEINVGLMKELTGGDTIIARGLNKDPIEFKPQFKMVLTCNDLPSVSANDRGTWRRISVVEFISKFVDEPDPKEPYEFKIDDTLEAKLKIWPDAFMFILIEYFKKYKKHGIKEPSEVKNNTENYKADSDIFISFINEKIIETDNLDSPPSFDDLHFVYSEWHKQTYGNNPKPYNKKEFKNNLIKKFGNKANNSNKWIGIAFKDNTNTFMNDGF